MPDSRTQRYLGWITFLGVFASCFGCGLYANNQVNAGVAFLVLAWIVLVPIFVYLLRTRRRLKKVSRIQQAQRDQELEALASLGKTFEGDEENEPS